MQQLPSHASICCPSLCKGNRNEKAEGCVVDGFFSVHRFIYMLFSIVFHNSHNSTSSTLLGSSYNVLV